MIGEWREERGGWKEGPTEQGSRADDVDNAVGTTLRFDFTNTRRLNQYYYTVLFVVPPSVGPTFPLNFPSSRHFVLLFSSNIKSYLLVPPSLHLFPQKQNTSPLPSFLLQYIYDNYSNTLFKLLFYSTD